MTGVGVNSNEKNMFCKKGSLRILRGLSCHIIFPGCFQRGGCDGEDHRLFESEGRGRNEYKSDSDPFEKRIGVRP